MANQCKLIQNIAGSITKSNIAKVGLGESINMYFCLFQHLNLPWYV